jgi:hypothetical protein
MPAKQTIWNKNFAYLIGLITTDGSLSSSGRHIVFTSTDKQLLQLFCSILNISENSIKPQKPSGYTKNKTNYKQAFRIQIGNVHLYKCLLSIGLHPNKSKTLGRLDIPDKYFPDFLRGWIDGDGSIFTYIDNYMSYKNRKYQYLRLYIQLPSASKSHLKWLQANIQRLNRIKGALALQHAKRSKYMWRIRYSKKESIKLLNWIYYQPNLPCLKRKYIKAKPFLVNN